MLTGFDIDRGDMRSFYREDIERYLDISFRPASRNTTKREQMFRRLRTARFLKTSAKPDGVEVGYSGVAARIARVHQFGLRDKVNSSGAMATYPRRELLGLSKADRMAIARHVIDSLGGADGDCRADPPAGEHRPHRHGDGDRRGKWRVRVQSGELETTWLRWNAQRAGAFKVWVPPSIGEQVWFLCTGGNTDVAFIGGSLYSDDNPAPARRATRWW